MQFLSILVYNKYFNYFFVLQAIDSDRISSSLNFNYCNKNSDSSSAFINANGRSFENLDLQNTVDNFSLERPKRLFLKPHVGSPATTYANCNNGDSTEKEKIQTGGTGT